MIPAVTRHRIAGTPSIILLHFDGTNGSTTFTDVYSHSFSASGSAALTTSNFEFGTASLNCGSSAGYILSSHVASDYDLGASNFTFECWIYQTAISTNTSTAYAICAMRATTAAFGPFNLFQYNNQFNFSSSFSGSANDVLIAGGTPVANTWLHVAAVRLSNICTLYVGGTSVASQSMTGTPVSSTNNFTIGGGSDAGGFVFSGQIDEFRYGKVARYNGNFTPTGPFTQ